MSVYDMNGGRGYQVDAHINQFFKCPKDKQVKIIPETVKWAAGYLESQKRMQNQFNR
ncbi:hypothetical protein ABIB50_003876 [Mucilaginibacter sp. UYCu711]